MFAKLQQPHPQLWNESVRNNAGLPAPSTGTLCLPRTRPAPAPSVHSQHQHPAPAPCLHHAHPAPAPNTSTLSKAYANNQHPAPALSPPRPSTQHRPCFHYQHHVHSQLTAPTQAPGTQHQHRRQQPVSTACTASSQHQHRHPAPSTSNLSPPRTQPAHSTSTSIGAQHRQPVSKARACNSLLFEVRTP